MTYAEVIDQAGVARRNRSATLEALRSTGPTSRTELGRRTGLTKATISVIVEHLLREGLVRELGVVTPRGPGRPARLVEYVASSHVVAGIHLGVRTTHVVLADGAGHRIADRRIATRARDPRSALSAAADAVRSLCDISAVVTPQVVGLCVPGRVDTVTGVCHRAPNLGWTDVPAGSLLRDQLGADVHLVNDAQAALIAEHASGVAVGEDDVVVLYAGDGVSAAVLTSGTLLTGSSGASGEVGHCPVPGATRRCGCGRIGCLETEASTGAVLEHAQESLRNGRHSQLRLPGLTSTQVLDAAQGGDAVARDALLEAGRRLGAAAGLLVNLFDPAVLVLAGELSRAGDLLLDVVAEAAADVALPDSWGTLRLEVAAHADDAEVLGALVVAARRLDLLQGQAVAT